VDLMFNVTLEPVNLTTHHDKFYNLSFNCDNKHLFYLYLLVGTNTYRTPNETTYRVLCCCFWKVYMFCYVS